MLLSNQNEPRGDVVLQGFEVTPAERMLIEKCIDSHPRPPTKLIPLVEDVVRGRIDYLMDVMMTVRRLTSELGRAPTLKQLGEAYGHTRQSAYRKVKELKRYGMISNVPRRYGLVLTFAADKFIDKP